MRRRNRWLGLLALPPLLAACGETAEPSADQLWAEPGSAEPSPEAWGPAISGVTNDLWFVELETPPLVRGGSRHVLKTERDDFHRHARRAGIRYHQRLSFGRLWNGLSIRVDPEDLTELARIPGVKAIYPVVPIEREDINTGAEEQELFTALGMTGASVAQNDLGLTGEGIKVGIIDSGIDYDNPDLGGCFGPGCRVAYGTDLVGDAFGGAAGTVPVPDSHPDDCGGHGSHVAGIVGANGAVKGVAPAVTFGAYRVFGCTGSTSADLMIQAMERASGDGMRVVNMSIGSGYQWPQYPTAVAADNLVDDGVVVVTSGGNNGGNGVYATGAPGVGSKVIATASFDNTHVVQTYFTISPDGAKIGYSVATASAPVPASGSIELVRTGTTTSTNDACTAGTPPVPGSLTGKVALIRRSGCGFYEKVKNAEAAGAVGVVLYNNVAGTISPTVAGTPAVQIPVVAITAVDGELINARMDTSTVTVSWTGEVGPFPSTTAGLLSSFSSYGPGPDLVLKPDIGAPGGNIYSTLPLEKGGHGTDSGTSMASPHVAGLVALLIQARPSLPAEQMRLVLQNTAEPMNQTGSSDANYPYRQGAGMARVDKAVAETVIIAPSKISLGESDTGPVTRTLTLSNIDGSSDVTLDLSHRPSLSTTGPTLTPSASATGFAGVAFSAPSVTIPAGGTATVDVTITPDPQGELAQGALFGGYLVFTAQGDGRKLSVPYAGFKGDYQLIQAISSKDLTRYVNAAYVPQPNGGTFTMKSGDIPYLTLHFAHQATQIKVDAYAVLNPADPNYLAKLKPQGNVLTVDYIGRNATAVENNSYSWNGTTKTSKSTTTLPNGYYVLKLSALKALGDAANPAHWETWTSPIIKIARP